MANGHGGHRTPSNPAPVSGPGRLSRRTDGGPGQKIMLPTGQDYGDRQALHAQESSAPMSQADSVPTASVPSPAAGQPGPGPSLTPLDAPSARPDEPVTHGVDIGEGGGPEAMSFDPSVANGTNVAPPTGAMTQMLQQMSATDTTGVLAALYQSALAKGA